MIPDSVTSIGEYAFVNCDSLTSVSIPDGVTSIGRNSFAYCTFLTSLTIGRGVASIGDFTFSNCTSLSEINYNATDCADLILTTNHRNNVFCDAGDNGDGITVTIGANVTKIPANLFCPYGDTYSPYIVSVVFAENSVCESIGSGAFKNCTTLTSIKIPKSVRKIGEYAFYNCISLASLIFENVSGWWFSYEPTATSGTAVDLSDPAKNAQYFCSIRSAYLGAYWNRG